MHACLVHTIYQTRFKLLDSPGAVQERYLVEQHQERQPSAAANHHPKQTPRGEVACKLHKAFVYGPVSFPPWHHRVHDSVGQQHGHSNGHDQQHHPKAEHGLVEDHFSAALAASPQGRHHGFNHPRLLFFAGKEGLVQLVQDGLVKKGFLCVCVCEREREITRGEGKLI